MIHTFNTFAQSLLLALSIPSQPATPALADVGVQMRAPSVFVEGGSFVAHLEISAPDAGGSLPVWALTGAAFTLDGKRLDESNSTTKIALAPGQKIVTDLDLAPLLAKAKAEAGKPMKLGLVTELGDVPSVELKVFKGAESGLNFMEMPLEDLTKFNVLIQTNRGDMLAEFWPDVAPNHVRNFLDLAYTKYYDGLTFHRVIPGFMIQGGDKAGTGSGPNGPRTLKAEFQTEKKHLPGVLSMARTADPNSASTQFFVMHGPNPGLDGKYSAFGKLVTGLDVVDKIVNAKRNNMDKPNEPQVIQKMIVVRVSK